MSIKNAEAERLSREVARLTGESLTEAVTVSLRDRLQRLTGEVDERAADRLAEANEIVKGSRARWDPALLTRSYDDVLYDDRGLPR